MSFTIKGMSQIESSETLPCAYCGSTALVWHYHGKGKWQIACTECEAASPIRQFKTIATDNWNILYRSAHGN